MFTGISAKNASATVEKCWDECNNAEPKELIQNPDLTKLFMQLKQQDIKIAVCTSDNRETTTKDFERLEMLPYIDSTVCGDDIGTHPKPNIKNIQYICTDTGISIGDTVIVGDTEADVKMGYDAG